MIFLAFEDYSKLLAEAERQNIVKQKKARTPEKEEQRNREREEQKQYLNPRIIKCEKKKPFKVRLFCPTNPTCSKVKWSSTKGGLWTPF